MILPCRAAYLHLGGTVGIHVWLVYESVGVMLCFRLGKDRPQEDQALSRVYRVRLMYSKKDIYEGI
jgi:hypothetical protein